MTSEIKKRGKLQKDLWQFFLTCEKPEANVTKQKVKLDESQNKRSGLNDSTDSKEPAQKELQKIYSEEPLNLIKSSKGMNPENVTTMDFLRRIALPGLTQTEMQQILEAFRRKKNQDVMKVSQEKINKMGLTPLQRLVINQAFCFEFVSTWVHQYVDENFYVFCDINA